MACLDTIRMRHLALNALLQAVRLEIVGQRGAMVIAHGMTWQENARTQEHGPHQATQPAARQELMVTPCGRTARGSRATATPTMRLRLGS